MASTNTPDHHTSADSLKLVSQGQCRHPHAILGPHTHSGVTRVLLMRPQATDVRVGGRPAVRIPGTDIFECTTPAGASRATDRVVWTDREGNRRDDLDAYAFPLPDAELDLHLFSEGKHLHAYRFLGANSCTVKGELGLLFATWAPNASAVSVVGDFNDWDHRRHLMSIGGGGVWRIFIPEVGPGLCYKFAVRSARDNTVRLKSDPYGRAAENRPGTASVTPSENRHRWRDETWLADRAVHDWQATPLSIYEVHLGSWRRDREGGFLSYRDLAASLIPYVKQLAFTHVQLLPVTEHPLDASWGYQTTGYFAPTRRFGDADDLRYFVDQCHAHGLGVIIDWAPAHFPKDEHGLARFDGTPLYEHEDPRLGEHSDWGTLIFNYGRLEVKNFLIAGALYWLDEFHVDGLRVDAVASMLYLDYSRKPGEWVPNRYGGNENLEAITFLRELNEVVHGKYPGALVIAEESTAWPQVTRPTWLGGLGFSMKWNMGWMNDTLAYMAMDPVFRAYHHDLLTFGIMYAFTENFVLPLSHDEVVHEKCSMLNKMPGDRWRQFANLRLLYTFMWCHPGKKLLFMGNEFAQRSEWDFDSELQWDLLNRSEHKGVADLVRDLNRVYKTTPALHRFEFEGRGFTWVDCHDADNSVINFLRFAEEEFIVVCLNFTPIPRRGYKIGVPKAGRYVEILNSDSHLYGGSDTGNAGELSASNEPWMNQPCSLSLTLPPLAGILFRFDDA